MVPQKTIETALFQLPHRVREARRRHAERDFKAIEAAFTAADSLQDLIDNLQKVENRDEIRIGLDLVHSSNSKGMALYIDMGFFA